VVYPVLTNEEMTESQRYKCFIRNRGKPSLNMPVQRLKVAILPLDLPCSGPVTHSDEIVTTGKSHVLPRIMKHYSPPGRRNYGRPLKRFLDT
jgi:hypothetical protein